MPYKDRDTRLAYHKKYNSMPERKEIVNFQYKKKYDDYKQQLYDLLGRECIKCGYDDIRALQFDHIKGNGGKDRKSLGGGMYRYYVKRPVLALITLQVLCANCNWIKRHEEDEINSHRRIG